MIHWFIYNFMVLFASLFVILEKSYAMSIGLLAPLAWIILPITVFLTIQWLSQIQWVIIDGLIILMSVLVIIEKSLGTSIGFLSPLAWLVMIIMVILIAKDMIFMRIKR